MKHRMILPNHPHSRREVVELQRRSRSDHSIRPMRTGEIELPALEFKSETESLTTAATQITVGERVNPTVCSSNLRRYSRRSLRGKQSELT